MQDAPTGRHFVCPTCRNPPQAWRIDNQSGACENPTCDRRYANLTNTEVALVVAGDEASVRDRDVDVDFSSETAVRAWIDDLAPGSDRWEEAVRLGMYARMHYGTPDTVFERIYDRFLAPKSNAITDAIDLGCGPGRFAQHLGQHLGCRTVGLDSWPLGLRFAEAAASRGGELYIPLLADDSVLRVAPLLVQGAGTGSAIVDWACSDITNPPLAAESFDLVVASSFFDTVVNPGFALGQASALLKPGGLLLLAQPDAWSASVTSPDAWMSATEPRWEQVVEGYDMRIVDRADDFAWSLARTSRMSFHYRSHAQLVVKTV